MKTAYYHWGEFEKEEIISKQHLKEMRELTGTEMLGFDIRNEDRTKTFYAPEDYIDAGPDGIAVKFAYGVNNPHSPSVDKPYSGRPAGFNL